METMYAPQNNSPHTELVSAIGSGENTLTVADGDILPDAPNVLTVGLGEDAELVLMMAKTGNILTVTRGFNGTAPKAWQAGEWLYRAVTAQDISALQTAAGVLQGEIDRASGSVDVVRAMANRLYDGADLTVVFAAEIAAAPYSGNVWAWIKGRAQAGNFEGLNVGDYVPFAAAGNAIKAEVAGIDTYYNYGDAAAGHHIDFISRDCWPELKVFNRVNYNNGTSVSPSPWLASELHAWLNSVQKQVPNAETANPALVTADYRTTGVLARFPAALQNAIVSKRMLLPSRYTAGSLLTADNVWTWEDAGKLWVPSEIEVHGVEHWGSKNGFSGGSYQQYPIFAQNMKRVKGAGDGGERAYWWLSTAIGGGSVGFSAIFSNGNAANPLASNANVRVPICFRIG